jgi:acyl-coenzyme A thioesterase PaaI-like protein
MADPLHPIARDARERPALPADPRPGTRDLGRTALGALGIELVRCEPDLVVARMQVDGSNGCRALLLVLAETVASTAAGLRAGADRRAFGAELNASWPTRPTPGVVVAVARPLQIRHERHVWRIVAIDACEALVLEGRCTLGVVDAPS